MSLLTALKMAPWVAILILLGVVSYDNGQIHKWHLQNDKCAAARIADRQSYENAQAEADAKNKADVSAQEAKSREITKETQSAYQSDLAKLRAADAERLRQARAAAAQSPAGKPDSPQGASPAAGADADGLRLSTDEHLQAEQIELRLLYLQNWVRDQLNAQ